MISRIRFSRAWNEDSPDSSFVRIANRLLHNGRQARTALISDTVSGVQPSLVKRLILSHRLRFNSESYLSTNQREFCAQPSRVVNHDRETWLIVRFNERQNDKAITDGDWCPLSFVSLVFQPRFVENSETYAARGPWLKNFVAQRTVSWKKGFLKGV